MMTQYKFNRMEIAGSLGDLGTILPIVMGMILINGLNPMGIFLSLGLFYILTGLYFKLTVPVEPMKVIGAYAIATGMSASQISASGLLVGCFLLIIGGTNAITVIGKYIPKSVVRGVQLSTGVLLMAEGVRFIIGTAKFQVLRQAIEPYLVVQTIGPIPISMVIGVIGGLLTLLLLENKRFPAGLFIVSGGIVLGILFGTHEALDRLIIQFNIPEILPFGFPT
ncbi:MAG: putative sulfate/molybdate transporter, partial [Proteobacteria bacterium]|nr:putative sulfate/molybdate transporter [Pseudomonadota bacterium]